MTGLTATDLFCGAGGSTTGLKSAGVRVVMAANHWRRAIETHSANHPDTEHDCADLRATHPSAYQKTDILTASPECTNHSLAKGRARKNIHQLDLWGDNRVDPAEERSRATMREVVEFAEFHRYKIIIVENVVEIAYWQHYDAWIEAMTGLGYQHRALYLNAQFFGVPQSRDRVYVVFWLRGIKTPDLDFRFPANCPDCGQVEVYQSFKKTRHWGRYGANRQYIYRCSACHKPVHPPHTPAAVAIDWGLPVQRIADRKRPLQPKTMQRIEAGLKKLHGQPGVMDTTHTHAAHPGKVSGILDPMPTQTTRQSSAMFLNMKGPNIAQSVEKPLGALTTIDSHCFIPTPAWLLTLRQSTQQHPIHAPLTTITAGGTHHALIYSHYGQIGRLRPTSEPLPAVMATDKHALLNEMPRAEDCGFRMLQPHELKLAMGFDSSYIITGNKREEVKQIGNAVACRVMEAISLRCVTALIAS